MAHSAPTRRAVCGAFRWAPALLLGGALCCVPAEGLQSSSTTGPSAAQPPSSGSAANDPSVELDKVIAIVNGDVLLESDVQEEMQFAALQAVGAPRVRTRAEAGRRLISRILILQQMKEQETDVTVSDEDVEKSLAELRKQIPACVKFHCETEQGWAAFLKQNSLTGQQVQDRWRQRILIVQFIDMRFRSGVRVTKAEIQTYYDKSFVPAFQKEGMKAPPVAGVTSRIEEILLQQHVNMLLQDWLTSLRDQGSVQILDPIYGQSSGNDSDDGGGMQ